MKILVTGGAGFIASHIADSYVKLGHKVVIIDNLSSGKKEFLNPKAIFYKADIRDYNQIKKIFIKENPEVINHHAAQISVRDSVTNPIIDANINIIGLLNILDLSVIYKVKKIIFASSGGVVYGDAKIIPTAESYVPLVPLSPYGVSKLTSEYYLNFFQNSYSISYIALRYSNVYGPRQNPHGEAGVVAIFSKKIINNEIPIINGNGNQTRDYVYVKDVVEANKNALELNISGSFNIGTSIETNVNQIFQKIKQIAKTDLDPIYGPAKKGEQKRSCLDTTLSNKKLKWSPKYYLEEGLTETFNYFKYDKKTK
jgi:UDP-glucose 4-epimerase